MPHTLIVACTMPEFAHREPDRLALLKQTEEYATDPPLTIQLEKYPCTGNGESSCMSTESMR